MNEELRKLLEKKAKLEHVSKMKKKLASKKTEIPFLLPEVPNSKYLDSANQNEDFLLMKASPHLTGYQFSNVDRTLLYEKVYLYEAVMETPVFQFDLKLKVEIEDESNFKIIDINVALPRLEECYILEIEPWFLGLAGTKIFHVFISGVSIYADKYTTRDIIMKQWKTFDNSCVLIEQCNEHDGGLFITLHSAKKPEHIYVRILWNIYFSEETQQIEHNIEILSIEDVEFGEKCKKPLKKLCQVGITDNQLENLWDELRLAVEEK